MLDHPFGNPTLLPAPRDTMALLLGVQKMRREVEPPPGPPTVEIVTLPARSLSRDE